VAFCVERLEAALDAADAGWRAGGVCIALSGGLDSTVLLHAAATLARRGSFRLRALHVDHGLQAESADWAATCRAACSSLDVPIRVVELGLVPRRGDSIEAAARDARRRALAEAIEPEERLLTAHHGDDQLETVLIQLLRGAGVAGLAAMPVRSRLGAGWQLRPLLGTDRAALLAYAGQHGLAWQRDPMNESLRFDRGWLRARVLPAIRERWPSAASTVSRGAAHLAEAARLLDDVAEADAAVLLDDGRLLLDPLARLPRERQVNVVRWWLRQASLRPPPAARLAAALPDFFRARRDGAPRLAWRDGEIRRFRGRLYAGAPLPDPPATVARSAPTVFELGPGLGRLRLEPSGEGGIAADAVSAIELRFRAGGESLRPQPGGPRRRLKDLCREGGVVPWMRERLPLVYLGGELAAVGDLWIDAGLAVLPGRPALKPVWAGRPRIY
jgi:tRNA(Ile)-lysidine synthase